MRTALINSSSIVSKTSRKTGSITSHCFREMTLSPPSAYLRPIDAVLSNILSTALLLPNALENLPDNLLSISIILSNLSELSRDSLQPQFGQNLLPPISLPQLGHNLLIDSFSILVPHSGQNLLSPALCPQFEQITIFNT